jgi:ABC-type ATPase involved in cell division
MLAFQNVTKVLNSREVLKDITFRIAPGECVCLSGPREAGKTLLLHLLLGTVCPTSGTVAVDGVDLSTISPFLLQLYRRSVGIAFGGRSLLPDRNVAQNVAFPLETTAMSSAEAATRVGRMLERVHLLHRSASLPCDLTEEERQRVLLARALIMNPKILLLDSLPSDIHGKEQERILHLILEANAGGATIVATTRDPMLFQGSCTRLLMLERGVIQSDDRLHRAKEPMLHPFREESVVHITPTAVA